MKTKTEERKALLQFLHENGLEEVPGPLEPGDLYVACRNTGPKLLTVHSIKNSYVVPVEMAYCYDVWECIKVDAA